MSTSIDLPPAQTPPLLGYANPMPLAEEGALLREGNLLLVREGAELPHLCVLCGEPTLDKGIRLSFSWDTSFHVTHQKPTLELRKSGTVHAHLCPSHQRQWLAGRILGIGGMIVSALLMAAGSIVAVYSDSSDIPRWTGAGISLLIAGFALFILFLFLFALRTRTLSCRRIDAGYLHLEGASESFLRQIPPAPTLL